MATVDDFIQVGTDIYKISYAPSLHDTYDRVLIKWNIETFKRDVLQDKEKLKKYDGFCVKPAHINYKQEHGKNENYLFYNKYHEISWEPKDGDMPSTKIFLKHIFGDQLFVGLDYLHLLFFNPTQSLPALCLVSSEKNTGKSTFTRWLKAIFEGNATYLENSALMNRFNSHWTEKLLLFFEEAKFYRDVEMDLLKDLITNDMSSTEKKGFDRVETAFYGKFILCSNHESTFIKIDKDETRFWIRKILAFSTEDPKMLDKLISEIPQFLNYIQAYKPRHKNETRHYFKLEVYKTDALMNVIQSSISDLEHNMIIVLLDIMQKLQLNSIQFTPIDLSNLMKNTKPTPGEIRRVLKNKWKLSHAGNTLTYNKISYNNNSLFQENSTGRFYTVTKEFMSENFDELMN